MAACTDPAKPWFGIDFLTWKPHPNPVLRCDGCGVRSDYMMSVLALRVRFAGETHVWPVIACQGCRKQRMGELPELWELSIALRIGSMS